MRGIIQNKCHAQLATCFLHSCQIQLHNWVLFACAFTARLATSKKKEKSSSIKKNFNSTVPLFLAVTLKMNVI